jgi:hypothetical protein
VDGMYNFKALQMLIKENEIVRYGTAIEQELN